MKIIDCHTHLGKDIFYEKHDMGDFDGIPPEQYADDLLDKLNNFNIDKALSFPFPSPLGQYDEDDFWYQKENSDIVSCNSECKLKTVPAFNPKDKESIRYADKLVRENNLKAFKVHTRTTKYEPTYLIPKAKEIIKSNDVPLILHIGSGKEEDLRKENIDDTLSSAIQLAKNNQNLRFTFAHLGRLHEDIREALALENVMMDTAALSLKDNWEGFIAEKYCEDFIEKTPKEIINSLLDEGYDEDIIWGSDDPFNLSYCEELNYVKENDCISKKEKNKLMYKNAKKWFDL